MNEKGRVRASVMEGESEIDLSAFSPVFAPPPRPAQHQLKALSEAANFPSRETKKSDLPPNFKREPRRHRTGRNVQFNAKASHETIDRFYKLCDRTGWVMGQTLERAVEALERELQSLPLADTPKT